MSGISRPILGSLTSKLRRHNLCTSVYSLTSRSAKLNTMYHSVLQILYSTLLIFHHHFLSSSTNRPNSHLSTIPFPLLFSNHLSSHTHPLLPDRNNLSSTAFVKASYVRQRDGTSLYQIKNTTARHAECFLLRYYRWDVCFHVWCKSASGGLPRWDDRRLGSNLQRGRLRGSPFRRSGDFEVVFFL